MDPRKGTGKKPKGSGRRLYTDENPKDTVGIKFATAADARATVKKVKNVSLHLIGGLQSNKVKIAVKLFDYIHSLDSEKLANKISSFGNSNLKIFIQVNLGNEEQKSGINANNLLEFYNYCKELKLNIIGLMCIPPLDGDTNFYFNKMLELKKKHSLNELSMGMSSDYLEAINFEASYIRIGSSIFGKRN